MFQQSGLVKLEGEAAAEAARTRAASAARIASLAFLTAQKMRVRAALKDRIIALASGYKAYPATLYLIRTLGDRIISRTEAIFNNKIAEVERLFAGFKVAAAEEKQDAGEAMIAYTRMFTTSKDQGEGSLHKQVEKQMVAFTSAIRGQFCLELAKVDGFASKLAGMVAVVAEEIQKNIDEGVITKGRTDLAVAMARLTCLQTLYRQNTRDLNEPVAYKLRAFYVGQALDELSAIRRELDPKNKNLREQVGFTLGVAKRLNLMRDESERDWDRAQREWGGLIRVVSYDSSESTMRYAINERTYLHRGPENGEAQFGLKMKMLLAGIPVQIEGDRYSVRGKNYVKVSFRGNDGQQVAGYVLQKAVSGIAIKKEGELCLRTPSFCLSK